MPSTATYTQAGRPLVLTTPLGPDKLLAVGLTGTEAISRLFKFTVEATAPRGTDVPFDKLLGQSLSLQLVLAEKGKVRYFSGICNRVLQGESDPDFTNYHLDLVPQFWLLTRKSQSRIFQHANVPDILKKVLAGLDVTYELRGRYEPRDYCVQYRESDFNFASRLMEEEGIYYFFKHAAGKCTMVVADTPQSHPDVPGPTTVVYKNVSQEGPQDADHVYEVAKSQDLVSGKFVLWDHTFERPHEHLAAEKLLTDSVQVGKVSHKLRVGPAAGLEVYDWPGEYAQRFDGIDRGGGEQPAELKKIDEDNKRTVDLRMQAEAAGAVSVHGGATARQFVSGHKFTLSTLAADVPTTPIKPDGVYVLTGVTHSARLGASYRSGMGNEGFRYFNQFTAIPAGLPFRPARTTPKPVVPGTQTAVVVGPPGEEIFTDKYGRIKVQFHWDREGKKNADSSCWVRVAQSSAGRHWGAMFIPRVGQEVVVDCLEGDPDQPICVGCVYNPDQMPMYPPVGDPEKGQKAEKTKSYIRTNSSPGGVGYNEVRFEDKAGQEQVYVHAQKDMDERVRNDTKERVGNDRHLRVGFFLPNDHKGDLGGEAKKGSHFEEVAVNQHLKVHNNFDEHIGGDYKLLVGGIGSGDSPGQGHVDIHIKKTKQELIDETSDLHVKKAVKEKFDATYDLHVGGAVAETFDATHDAHVKGTRKVKIDGSDNLIVGGARNEKVGSLSVTVGKDYQEKAGMKYAMDAGQVIHLKAGMSVVIEAGMDLTLKGPGGFININPAGVAIQGTMVLINSGGAASPGPGSNPAEPAAAKDAADAKDAQDAAPVKPKDADHSKTGEKSN